MRMNLLSNHVNGKNVMHFIFSSESKTMKTDKQGDYY